MRTFLLHPLLSRALWSPLMLVVVVAPLACSKDERSNDPVPATATAAPSPPAWLSVKDGKIHSGLEDAPIGLYVAGDTEDGRFVPGGDVEGQGPSGDVEGEKGFLALSTGTFVAGTTPPPPPWLAVTRAADGSYVAMSRRVTY
jgi:hypothetical protein